MHSINYPNFYSAAPAMIKISGNPLLGMTKKKKRIALVAQGGGQRGIFTAGVLDSFISQGFDPFEIYIGTSAGALNLTCFLAKKYGFAYRFITEYTTKNEFFNLIKYVRRRQPMNLNWALEAVDLSDPAVLGLTEARKWLQNRYAYASATDASTLSPHYFSMFQSNWLEVLKATSAIPLLYGDPVEIAGKKYIDGGVSDPIPAKESYSRGADIVVVIRTEPISADKKPISSSFLESLRNKMEMHLPQYLAKFHLESQKEKLTRYHALLSSRLLALHNKYTEGSWEQLKGRMSQNSLINGGRWLFSGDNIYRLQTLTGQKINLDMVNLLTKHYQSYQESIRFLENPPPRLQLIQLFPSRPLASSSLLSKNSHLVQDYYYGLHVGKTFMAELANPLNRISSLEQV